MKNYSKIRAKAPLRLSIAGGGSDVSPYSDVHGGAVLNATINLYAHTFLECNVDDKIHFQARDLKISEAFEVGKVTQEDRKGLLLHRAVYCHVMEQFNNGVQIPISVTTLCDAPPGSGLGSSSSLVVSMLEAYRELLALPLGEYDLAKLAYEIERNDCRLAGGKQDQYASAFGGFNFIEFGPEDRIVVNPLRIRQYVINELEASIILFNTCASRKSAEIINDQIKHITTGGRPLQAMHEIKNVAYILKASLLRGAIKELAIGLRKSWAAKKATSAYISNKRIDEIENIITSAGATSMKVSGAGGGGCIMILVKPEQKQDVIEALSVLDGKVINFAFKPVGVTSWRI